MIMLGPKYSTFHYNTEKMVFAYTKITMEIAIFLFTKKTPKSSSLFYMKLLISHHKNWKSLIFIENTNENRISILENKISNFRKRNIWHPDHV